MSTLKPNLTRVWAKGATPGNVVDPDVSAPGKFNDGWLAEVPTFQHFNFLQQLFTSGLAHNNEQGINSWDIDTRYPVDGLAKGSDGNVYLSRVEQSGNDPVGDNVNWGRYIRSMDVLTLSEAVETKHTTGDRVFISDRAMGVFEYSIGPVANTYNVVATSGSQVLVLQRNDKNSFTPRQFGFPTDGTTDCYAAWTVYRSSGISYFDWDDGVYSLSDFVQILTGTTHNFSGTILKALGDNKVLRAGFANGWAVTGNLTLSGTGNGSEEAVEDATVLFEFEDCKRYLVENVTCLDSLGKGFYFKGNSADRSQKGRLSNCYSYRCQKGWDLEANGSTEYTAFSNCGGSDNFIGVKTGAGNMSWMGGIITDNARNVELVAGDNHLHGTMVGTMINHASSENVLATDILNGFHFNGCNFYGDDTFAGRIDLNNSQGIIIDGGGSLDCRVQITTGLGTITGENRVSGMLIAGTNANFQGDLSKLVTYGHIGLGSIDAKAFNRQQGISTTLLGQWTGGISFTYNPVTNMVTLLGTVAGGSGDILTIPVGFRPQGNELYPVSAAGAFGDIVIVAATGMLTKGVGANTALRVDGIQWQAWQ